MSGRVIVGGADLDGLRWVAAAATELTGDAGAVEAVVLAVGGRPVYPDCGVLDDVGATLAGVASRLLVFEVAAALGMDAPIGQDWPPPLGSDGTAQATGRATHSGASLGRLVAAAAVQSGGDGLSAVLLADSPASREAAGRLAVELEGPCASMCERIRATDSGFSVERAIYGGAALGTLVLGRTPAICVFVVGKAEEAVGGAAPEVVACGLLGVDASPCQVLSRAPVEKTVDLARAKVVVAVGRGFAKADDLALVDGLLQELGAELGCTRPIAEDFKWLPKERQVGLTGSSVTADLYLAFGISGQVQHLAGIKGARVVVAVNNDPKAPIVRNADYVIVDDLYKVIPALTDAVHSGG